MVAAVILAGGSARRMGGVDKPLLPLGNGTVLSSLLSRLLPQVERVAINANSDAYDALGYPVLADRLGPDFGPLAGVHAGLCWAALGGHDRILTVTADCPFVPVDLVQRLMDHSNDTQADIVMAQSPDGRAQRLIAIWRTDLRHDIEAALTGGMRKVGQFQQTKRCAMLGFGGPSVDPFFNINTPEDLAYAQSIAAQMGGN